MNITLYILIKFHLIMNYEKFELKNNDFNWFKEKNQNLKI